MPDKSKINFLIDALMFLCMMAIAGLGFLMKYILPPGKERVLKYGNVELSLFGMDRHEWGAIHLYLAVSLLALLALHIVLHWKMIVNLFQKLIARAAARRVITPSFVAVSLLLLTAPFLVRPNIQPIGAAGNPGDACLVQVGGELEPCDGCGESGAGAGGRMLSGTMTLHEISQSYSMPIHFLKKSCGIPESTPNDATLAQLEQKYRLDTRKVEQIIQNYQDLSRRQGGRAAD